MTAAQGSNLRWGLLGGTHNYSSALGSQRAGCPRPSIGLTLGLTLIFDPVHTVHAPCPAQNRTRWLPGGCCPVSLAPHQADTVFTL